MSAQRTPTIPMGTVIEAHGEVFGRKNDAGKPNWNLLPLAALVPVIRVLEAGAAKYGDWNWKNVPNAKERYYAACMRHLAAWQAGEVADSETGQSHLAHALCCLLFVLAREGS